MKLLALEGSPRENGNTEKLVKAILESAKENGAETKFYKLTEMNISLCLGCSTCRDTGTCVTDDAMRFLLEEIQASDVIILGSPVYMWQVSGQMKVFMDRFVRLLKPDYSVRLDEGKRIAFAYTQGNPDAELFKVYMEYQEKVFGMFGFENAGRVIAAGTRGQDDILEQTELMEAAFALGEKLAQ